jgi:hypothetical protein
VSRQAQTLFGLTNTAETLAVCAIISMTGAKMSTWERLRRLSSRAYPRSYRREDPNPIVQHFRDRFTDDARQAIFFARYEAGSFLRSEITLEHLLLGLLRSDSGIRSTLGQGGVADVVRRIEASEASSRRIPANVDLLLSMECKRAATRAIDEATSSGELRVTTRHLIRAIRQ